MSAKGVISAIEGAIQAKVGPRRLNYVRIVARSADEDDALSQLRQDILDHIRTVRTKNLPEGTPPRRLILSWGDETKVHVLKFGAETVAVARLALNEAH